MTPGPGLSFTADQFRVYDGTQRLLREYSETDALAAFLRRAQEPFAEPPTVVVVGEVKRGKSSLVNALLGAELSPTGVEVVTAGFVRVVPPGDELPAGRAVLALADGTTREVPAAETAAHLHAGPDGDGPDGDGTSDDAASAVVIGATVAHAASALPGVVLVDTPGVGGLHSAHARVARRAVKKAGVLLVVTDGGQPLTAPELAFLADAATVVQTVVFAIAKTDRHPATWQQIRDENRRLLAAHAPRFADAPMVGVSAALATAAVARDDATAGQLLTASGLPELVATLTTALADRNGVALANLLRTGHSMLGVVLQRVEAQLAAATTPAGADLTPYHDALEAVTAREERWTFDLDRDLRRLLATMRTDVAQRCDDARERWTVRLKGERGYLGADTVQRYLSELHSELQMLAGDTADTFDERLSALLAGMFGDAQVVDTLRTLAPAQLAEVRLAPVQRATVRAGVFDPGLAFTGVAGAGMAARVFGPLGFVVGALWLGVNAAWRKGRLDRDELARVLTDTFQQARTDLTAAVEAEVTELKPEILVAFKRHLAAAKRAAREQLAAAQQAAAADEQQRTAVRTGWELRRDAVLAQRRALQHELDRLAAGP